MLQRQWRWLPHRFRRFAFRSVTVFRYFLLVLIAWTVLDTSLVHHRVHTASIEHQAQSVLQKPVRVYIASLHWNNERILRESWNTGVLELVKAFGPNNVFVSVFESGSWDHSKNALRELDKALGTLGAPRNVTLDETTHADEIASPPPEPGRNWIKTQRNRIELRRIPYLSRLRNISLQPLRDMAKNGTTFDYILFLNDVVFTVADALTLLNTNNGNYAAACSLDFSRPPQYYDTFALRDIDGHSHATQTWPYFRSSKSRKAIKHGKPVPVTSCWNGMVFMPAATFTGDNAIAFRGIDDSLAAMHLEGSECCLIHADNPASATEGVYLNPNVRVGYSSLAYSILHPGTLWLTRFDVLTGLWKNRLSRWFTTPWFQERTVWSRVWKWEQQNPGRKEDGTMCLINEMQVLVSNGWAHNSSKSQTDFSGTVLLYYLTPNYKVAEYYASYIKRRANVETAAIICVKVPNHAIKTLHGTEKIQRIFWPNPERKELIWNCRRRNNLPRHLTKYRNATLIIGTTSKKPDQVYGQMKSWEDVSEDCVLRVDGGEAIQYVFRGYDSTFLEDQIVNPVKIFPFDTSDFDAWVGARAQGCISLAGLRL
ncbi:hypothetical protein AK830_g3821 [Neonectria ditissima]|uniref:Alpha-1,3-mannosyltransferase CMT1 n=1 Tax=Neonectria ditissima TaxID=78410 RepID=A0A0N8H7U6_9HYPO|nr:hypothetical protein AK830_g3821 [Neonectria ditissima]